MMNNNNNNSNVPIMENNTECTNCRTTVDHKFLIHHIRLRGNRHHLCTSCVLKMHPTSFCPTCFEIFESIPASHQRLICHKCSSISHPNCIPEKITKPYLCPPCSVPDYSFFDIAQKEGEGDSEVVVRRIDKKAAIVLLCAARIAASSMNKAVVVARAETERRVREAAVCRKRAREALEHVAALAGKEKSKKGKDGVMEGSGSVLNEKKVLLDGRNTTTVVLEKKPVENKPVCKVPPLNLDSKVEKIETKLVQEEVSGTGEVLKVEGREKVIKKEDIRPAIVWNDGSGSDVQMSVKVRNLDKPDEEKAKKGSSQ